MAAEGGWHCSLPLPRGGGSIVSSGVASSKEKMPSKDAKNRESSTDSGVNKYGKAKNTRRCTFFFFSLESARRLSQVQESSDRPEVGVGDRKALERAEQKGREQGNSTGEGRGSVQGQWQLSQAHCPAQGEAYCLRDPYCNDEGGCVQKAGERQQRQQKYRQDPTMLREGSESAQGCGEVWKP